MFNRIYNMCTFIIIKNNIFERQYYILYIYIIQNNLVEHAYDAKPISEVQCDYYVRIAVIHNVVVILILFY